MLALDPLFADAASEFGVPESLLKAIGYTETRWQMVRGEVEFDGQTPAFGIMALRGDAVARGAQLAGVTEEAVRTDAGANLRAAAALLSAYANEAGIDRADLGAWRPVVARFSGISVLDGRNQYVDRVYRVVRDGVPADSTQNATLEPTQLDGQYAQTTSAVLTAGPDYAESVWRPSPNYNARPTDAIGDPAMIIIHTCEGSYSSCWSWLTDTASGVSAHYVVSEAGDEISQLVRESDRAWHIGATYDCNLNSGVECWRNGYSSNHFTVGIEHGGYASQTSFPTGQIDASAKLSCDITKDQQIPRDRYHILGHAQLQPYNRTDPGSNWPWTDYLNRIEGYCNPTIIVDSDNANNDTSKGYIQVSSNWISSSSTAGYYGSGYYYASTQAVSDPADFYFYLPAAATKTVDAWWTSGTNRSTTAPFVITDSGGTTLATVNVNQQINGSQWNTLGTWSFPAGWNRVRVSRWTTTGYVVIADAVRIR